MDIKIELVEHEPGLQETNFIIKIENVSENIPLGDIKAEKEVNIETPINRIPIKKEFGDSEDILEANVEVKKEIIDEPSWDEKGLPKIKPEELMLKSDSGDDDMGIHTGSDEHDKKSVKKYSCHFCGFKAHQQSTVTRHILSEHDNESMRKFECEFCNYTTCREWCLKIHVQKKHSGKKFSREYSCALCDYSTKQNARLKQHVLSKHNNETSEKFKCDICNYESFIKYDLKSHIKKKHNKGNKNHFCDVCEYTTYNKWYLQTHKLVQHHKDLAGTYACDRCSFRTHHKNYLKKHQMMKHE